MVGFEIAAQESLKVGRFFQPPNSPANPEDNAFSNNPVWSVGDVQTIQFTTTFLNYTIALWQQALPGRPLQGAPAVRGPIIFR